MLFYEFRKIQFIKNLFSEFYTSKCCIEHCVFFCLNESNYSDIKT